MNPIYPYRTQAVRDLAWSCFSPPLLTLSDGCLHPGPVLDCRPALTPEQQRWLSDLDNNPAALMEHLQNTSASRVGLYFEALWYFYLQHNSATRLVAHNLPVRSDKRTLGEFDCIYFCHRREQYVHLELAVKYFLGIEVDTAGKSQHTLWIGPNKRDRLDIKLQHMLDKQIQLADLPEAAAVLESVGVADTRTLLREIGVRGYLFQPLDKLLATPPGHQTETNGGNWSTLASLPQLLALCNEHGAEEFVILERIRWLSRAVRQAGDAYLQGAELIDSLARWFEQNERPLLVAALDASGVEQQRFFVTPDDWAESFA